MANLFEQEDRRVIPNWRSFEKTISLGELDALNNSKMLIKRNIDINEYILDWTKNKSLIHASDLISAAIVNNSRSNEEVINAAHFIIENKVQATYSQISTSKFILGVENLPQNHSFYDTITLDNISNLINQELIYEKIKVLKAKISVYHLNPILYVELSRYYSIIGQEIQSIKSMQIALNLAPHNRFVLRSAIRLFLHFDNESNDFVDYIHDFLRKSPLILNDPWLTSAEISIATLRGRNSKFIKKANDLVNSKNISPFNLSELASSLGTVELLNGNSKKSRDLFRKALISPNDNSLAQVEWASTKDKQLEIEQDKFNVKLNFEALALDNFNNNNFNEALSNSVKWFADMPFSKRPIMFGSSLSSTLLKDQKKSISLVRAGLISHPNDPQLINNLAYALALDNRPIEAMAELNKIKNSIVTDEVTNICLAATKGLALFRSGKYDEGRSFYIKAIEQTQTKQNRELNWLAILNYAREEVLINSEYTGHLIDVVSKIPDSNKDIVINTLKKDVLKLYAENNNNVYKL
ncbi:tetratricopeptide repeat protein [Chryseobacterium carnipullorum]|uniref:tetratricopeptide repeat protein n=1 Tax=Chryseobacterium carnipullorum TaxID=1124835 RepID=UPI000E8DA10E|nr:hypothetical protein [Chryseobacterium carnipullorum]HBV15267.1 hypothetical protein [Chryseobacterium carnipullorum]